MINTKFKILIYKTIYKLTPVKSIKKKIINSLNINEKILFSGIKFVDKETVSLAIKTMHARGVNDQERAPRFIVSLTSYPERMNELQYTIHSLLSQTFRPDKVVLWLSEDQFPNLEKDVPCSVLSMVERGLTIRFCKNDTRSFKKLIPSLMEFPEDIVITADDDLYYDSRWLEQLVIHHDLEPQAVCVHMAKKIEFIENDKLKSYRKWRRYNFYRRPCGNSALVFPLSGSGALFPPHCLHEDATNEDLFMKLTPYADDIWFWAMSVLNHTSIKWINQQPGEFTYVNPARELGLTGQSKLTSFNIQEGGNDRQFEAVLGHYPELRKRLSRPS